MIDWYALQETMMIMIPFVLGLVIGVILDKVFSEEEKTK